MHPPDAAADEAAREEADRKRSEGVAEAVDCHWLADEHRLVAKHRYFGRSRQRLTPNEAGLLDARTLLELRTRWAGAERRHGDA